MHKLINLQNKVNNELKWLRSQSLNPESVAEISEKILPEFTYITGKERQCIS